MKKITSLILAVVMVVASVFVTDTATVQAADKGYFAYRVDCLDGIKASNHIAVDVIANFNGKVYISSGKSGGAVPTASEIKKSGITTEISAGEEVTAYGGTGSGLAAYIDAGGTLDVYILAEDGTGKTYGPYVKNDWKVEYYPLGSGTASDPYQIWNYRHLFNIRKFSKDASVHFKLMQDIDLSDLEKPYLGYVSGSGYEFAGEFDGNNKSIIGLNGGLVTKTSATSVIKNLHFVDANKKYGKQYSMCGLITDSNYGLIENCAIINSDYYVSSSLMDTGMFVGINRGTITNCMALNNRLESSGGNAMGIIAGRNYMGSTIKGCYVENCTLTTDSNSTTGGIVGRNDGTIDSCYFKSGSFDCNEKGYIAGIAGVNKEVISNCISGYYPKNTEDAVLTTYINVKTPVWYASITASQEGSVYNNTGAVTETLNMDPTNKDYAKYQQKWVEKHGNPPTGAENYINPITNTIATTVTGLNGIDSISFNASVYFNSETSVYNAVCPFTEKVLGDAKEDDKKEEVDAGNNTIAAIADEKENKAVYVAPKDNTKKQIEVPEEVAIDGKTYNIAGIKSGAFKDCKDLIEIIIKSLLLDAKNIEAGAFDGVSSNTTITVPETKVDEYSKLFVDKGLNKEVKVEAPRTDSIDEGFGLDKYYTFTQKTGDEEATFSFTGNGNLMSIYVSALQGEGTLLVRDSKKNMVGYIMYPVEKTAYNDTECYTIKTKAGEKYVATVDRLFNLKGDFTYAIKISTKGNNKLKVSKIKWQSKAFTYDKSKKTLKIKWKKAKNHGYELWYATSKNGKYTRLITQPVTNHSMYTAKKLKKGKKYYFKVRAVDSSISNTKYYGPFSAVKSFKIPK